MGLTLVKSEGLFSREKEFSARSATSYQLLILAGAGIAVYTPPVMTKRTQR
jgi:hypothetical protein